MSSRYVLAVLAVMIGAGLLAPLGTEVPGLSAQAPPCGPCPCTFDRTVQPQEVLVNEKVHVTIDLDCDCPGQGATKGIDVFFVVDRTNLMFDTRYIDPTQQAITAFVNKMDFAKGAAGLITYAVRESVRSNLTKDRQLILQAVNTIRRSEESDVRGLSTAFRTATTKLDNDGTPGNEKVIMIFVAGQDVDGRLVNMPTVTQAARNAGVMVVFFMFPNARFSHYVEASTVCTNPICPNWSGLGRHWAWGVDKNNVQSIVGTQLAGVLLREPELSVLEIYEAMNSGAGFDLGSAAPLPSRPQVPPYVDIYWDYAAPSIPASGAHIEYDAEMVYADVTYPVTDISRGRVLLSDGQECFIDLPNPPVTVRGAMTPTPTVAVTSTPTASPTATQSAVPDTPTPTATTTPDPGDRFEIFLPVTAKMAEL